MKKTILIVALLTSGFVFQTASAQVKFGISVNIGTQPVWGPVGYDHVEYYYLPDIDAFYYVPRQQYIYMDRGRWVFRTYLPTRYSNYDVYTGYKVVINEPTPYRNAEMYRSQYGGYRGRHDQEIIRNSHDSRYFENKNHPQHREWRRNNNGRNNNNGNNNNNGRGNRRN
jgi:hypothetical protein